MVESLRHLPGLQRDSIEERPQTFSGNPNRTATSVVLGHVV
jgi:hypothetical protein